MTIHPRSFGRLRTDAGLHTDAPLRNDGSCAATRTQPGEHTVTEDVGDPRVLGMRARSASRAH